MRGSARTISHIEPSAIPSQRQSVSSVVTIRVRQLLRGRRGHPPNRPPERCLIAYEREEFSGGCAAWNMAWNTSKERVCGTEACRRFLLCAGDGHSERLVGLQAWNR